MTLPILPAVRFRVKGMYDPEAVPKGYVWEVKLFPILHITLLELFGNSLKIYPLVLVMAPVKPEVTDNDLAFNSNIPFVKSKTELTAMLFVN